MDKIESQSSKYIHRGIELSETKNQEVIPYVHRLLARKEISDDEALASFTSFFFAGVDTTAHSLLWVLFHLANNPAKQDLLYQEIVKAVDGKKDDTFTSEHMRLPYLNAILRESHRLTPIGHTFTIRRIDKPISIHGFEIPAFTKLDFYTYPMQNDSKFVDSPNEFFPERWLKIEVEKRKGTTKEILDHKLLSEPFGFGPRMCLGSRIAKAEMKAFIFRLILDWKFSCEPKNPQYKIAFLGPSKASPFPNVKFEAR